MKANGLSRRKFMAAISAGPLAAAAGVRTAIGADNTTGTVQAKHLATGSSPMREYMTKGKRLTISMWDFSWLKANHPGGAYEDLERRVAEAAELGYNTLRVDCFPSRIPEKESHFEKNRNPGDLPFWGMTKASFACNVRSKVAELATCCRKHNVWLGLDCWDKPHMLGHSRPVAEADEEKEFAAYADKWVKALKMMREDGVLERAVWVAPMNEVPHFGSRSLEAISRLRARPLDEGETVLEKNQEEDAIYRRVNRYMGEPIKAEIAGDGIPLSYSSLGAERFANRLSDAYDVVDVHFMPGVITDDEDKKAFAKAQRGVPPPHRFKEFARMDLKAYSHAWDVACRKHYRAMLKRTRDFHETCLKNMTLPSGKHLVAINTEPFGPCFWPDHPDVSWDWYKRYNADAMRTVATLDLAGTSLSNYAEPIFSLWEDADWHYTSNMYFLEQA